jgi:asparagine synthase (glutamine-hydrolysing)
MTALAGLWRFDDRPDAANGCARMLAAQALYGPHDGAQWVSGGIALGRRLMRVLPEDNFDRQPLVGGEGRYVLVADLRLDNRDELIKALGIWPMRARDFCDAALLLAAIERWDEDCLERLVGDYAFALWDGARRRLLLARDPLGRRPLHYHRGSNFFAFASMPKGLHALPEVPYAPDEEQLVEFLLLMPETGTRSFFLNIERIESGHIVTITANGLAARPHWRPNNTRINFRRSEDYVEALRSLLDRAVHCRLRGTSDVGVYLSGGLDSGAVAATAARLLTSSSRRLVAFTAVPGEGYDGPAPSNQIVDEGPYAAATASLYPNMEHVLIRSHDRSPLDDLDRNFFLFDRPVLNICNAVWENSIANAMRQRQLTVALDGSAGNMGLSYAGTELLPELFGSGQWLHWWREAWALVAQGRVRWRGILAGTFGPWCPADLWLWLNKIATGNILDVGQYTAVNPHFLARRELRARAKARDLDLVYRPWKNGVAMRLWVLKRVDVGNYSKGLLGGWQIDCRDPTADVRLIEFCLAVPTEQFLRNGMHRALARAALVDRLPQLVLDEPRWGLQAADWHEQLTAVRDRVRIELDRLGACPPAKKILDLPRLSQLVENWPSGGWEREEVSTPYRSALLRAISTGHFLRRATASNC